MKKINMTTEDFHQFLKETSDDWKLKFNDGGIYRDDLEDLKLDYVVLNERQSILRYLFCVNDGFVIIHSEFESSKLNLNSIKKVDDQTLKEIMKKKETLLKELDEVNTVLEYYRLKTLFL